MEAMDITSMSKQTFEFQYPFKFERDFNEESTIQWMSQNWSCSITLSAVYVAVIFGLKYFMQSRPKYDLRPQLIAWSGILALFSIASTIRLLSESIYVTVRHGWEYSVCSPTIYFGDTAIWAFLFAASKGYELGDTVFIVLRKQPLIFLHWYHHITVMIYSWYTYAYFYAPGRWYASINSLVHSFMYSYYFLKAMRFYVPRWVNMFVTSIQLLQMAFGIYVNLSAKWVLERGDSCHVTYDNITYSLLMYASYFMLFGHFFYNAYLKPKDAGSAQHKTNNGAVKYQNGDVKNIANGGTEIVKNGVAMQNGNQKKIV